MQAKKNKQIFKNKGKIEKTKIAYTVTKKNQHWKKQQALKLVDEARERDGKRSGQAENPKQSRRKPKQAKSSFSRKKKKQTER